MLVCMHLYAPVKSRLDIKGLARCWNTRLVTTEQPAQARSVGLGLFDTVMGMDAGVCDLFLRVSAAPLSDTPTGDSGR